MCYVTDNIEVSGIFRSSRPIVRRGMGLGRSPRGGKESGSHDRVTRASTLTAARGRRRTDPGTGGVRRAVPEPRTIGRGDGRSGRTNPATAPGITCTDGNLTAGPASGRTTSGPHSTTSRGRPARDSGQEGDPGPPGRTPTRPAAAPATLSRATFSRVAPGSAVRPVAFHSGRREVEFARRGDREVRKWRVFRK